MFEQLDSRSPTPLYDQIAARIRVAVAAGDLNAGDALPSVRQMAGQLRVNPATVVQAYRALESEGFVEPRKGSGTYVRDLDSDRLAGEKHEAARTLVTQMLVDGGRLGLTTDDLKSAIREKFNWGDHEQRD